MTNSIIDRAESIIREALAAKNDWWRKRAEKFLNRQPGRPRKVDKEECKRLRAAGFTAEEIAKKLKCHACNVRRCWK